MRFSLPATLFSALASVGVAVAVPTTQPVYCEPTSAAVPLLRLYNPTVLDHFYTTNVTEANNAVAAPQGYTREGTAGLVFPSPGTGTVPLYRLYNATIFDHFYTISASGVDFAVQVAGYTLEGVAGYVYPAQECGAVPLYRLYSAQQTDHFYTTSAADRDSAISGGYSDEGVDGYIIPN
ncbi:hypothetical protein P691DRAFT_779818 [Macrolepiota fuliginosa MF-IS2]|uniref:DUF5648 domain-containing protein n=1 Tax=Macrolepiota fuliginosa MF-IS2 TaxID=1400762 RepID=A0A9P5WZV0_9AGAR|nr:hypothetical protein P691DRAFT_779818 [Macrolepiota fuliginosa MF-IS2]